MQPISISIFNMTKRKLVSAAIVLWLSGTTALAGGILTNTNQSVDFLMNPARNAAIGIDGDIATLPVWHS